MVNVYGHVTQMTTEPVFGLQARVQILIPENVMFSSSVVITRPAPVTPDPSGYWVVNLLPSVLTRPAIDYSLMVTWLDAAGNFVSEDRPNFTFRVPLEGGQLRDLIITRPSAFQVAVTAVEPAPAGDNLFWLNPSSGDLYQAGSN